MKRPVDAFRSHGKFLLRHPSRCVGPDHSWPAKVEEDAEFIAVRPLRVLLCLKRVRLKFHCNSNVIRPILPIRFKQQLHTISRVSETAINLPLLILRIFELCDNPTLLAQGQRLWWVRRANTNQRRNCCRSNRTFGRNRRGSVVRLSDPEQHYTNRHQADNRRKRAEDWRAFQFLVGFNAFKIVPTLCLSIPSKVDPAPGFVPSAIRGEASLMPVCCAISRRIFGLA